MADPERRGEQDGWFRQPLADAGAQPVRLPGSAQMQGIGAAPDVSTAWVGGGRSNGFYDADRYAPYREPDKFKIPFWLQPERVYVGAVWYQREIVIGDDLAGHDTLLSLERVHWESTLWVDDLRIGSDRSLSTPHRYAVPALSPGIHLVTLRIDNSTIVDVGPNAHSVSDHTQGGWNGVIGGLTLQTIARVRILGLRVHTDPVARSIHVRGRIEADSLAGASGVVTLEVRPVTDPAAPIPAPLSAPIDMPPGKFHRGRATTGAGFDIAYPLGDDARLWDEFDPFVYELTTTCEATSAAGASTDRRVTRFGLRSVEAVGTRIHVNGRPTFLRGTLECCVFPLTGYPDTDEARWARIFATCRSFGLNHVRFHSWCPPEAAFRAADVAGMYLQVEGPIWANQGAAIGEGRDVDSYLYEESERIIAEFGDHPSFLLMAHGNEPFGRDAEILTEWVGYWQRRDPRRLYTSAGGWPALEISDFDSIPDPRVQAWGEGLDSRINGRAPETVTDYADWVERTPRPIITHEAGQWCAYLDFAEIEKYDGFMKPRNFEIARDFLEEGGMLHQAKDFLFASGRLQVMAYKEEVESALRTPGFGGIQLLGLNDFPGQGTAPVGVVDAFWDAKAYVEADEFARFFGPTVPLALLPRRVFRAGDPLTAAVRVAHFGASDVAGRVSWQVVTDDGRVVDEGIVYEGVIGLGNERDYGDISASLISLIDAQRVRLVVTLTTSSSSYQNDWSLWVYPDQLAAGGESDVVVTRDLADAIGALAEGRRVVLAPRSEDVASPVSFGFSPVFWNTSWTNGQEPHTLGVLCDPAHPAFADFPTAAHTDWQWWELALGAKALDLSVLSIQPIVQVIDSWFDARRLGLILEARVGAGRLLVSTIDVVDGLEERIVARQLRASLLTYVASGSFRPTLELDAEQVSDLIRGRLG